MRITPSDFSGSSLFLIILWMMIILSFSGSHLCSSFFLVVMNYFFGFRVFSSLSRSTLFSSAYACTASYWSSSPCQCEEYTSKNPHLYSVSIAFSGDPTCDSMSRKLEVVVSSVILSRSVMIFVASSVCTLSPHNLSA